MPRKAKNEGLFQRRDHHTGEQLGTWYLPVFVSGKKYIRTTGTDNLDDAKAQIPFVVAKLMKELGEDDSKRTSRKEWRLSELLDHAIAFHEVSGRPNTVKSYLGLKKNLLEFFGNIKIELLSQDGIRKYCVARMKSPRAPQANSVAGELTKLVSALHQAKTLGAFGADPKSLIPPDFKFKRVSRKKFLTQTEISNLFQALDAHGYSKIIPHVRTYLNLGLRKEELWEIKVRHVDLFKRTVLVPGTKTASSYATLPLPEALVEEFSKRMEGRELDDRLFERCGIWHMVRTATTKARIPPVSIHDLRRTTGSLLISAGANLKVVQQILRHQNIEVTSRHYAHLIPNVLPQEINKIAALIEPLPLPLPAE